LVTAAAWSRNVPILECLDEHFAQLIDLVRVQRPEQWAEAADQRIQIQRGFGTGQRDRLTGPKRLEPPGPFFERQVAVAEQVVVSQHRPGSLGQGD
jgi:hypothetical protein